MGKYIPLFERDQYFSFGKDSIKVDLHKQEKLYSKIFGKKLNEPYVVFNSKLLKTKVYPIKISSFDVDGGFITWEGKVSITLEGLLTSAFNCSGETKYKDLEDIIQNIFFWKGKFLDEEILYEIDVIQKELNTVREIKGDSGSGRAILKEFKWDFSFGKKELYLKMEVEIED